MTSLYGETGQNGFKLRLDYEITAQSAAKNQSTVHMALYLYANTTGSYNGDGSAYWSLCGRKTSYSFRYTAPAWYLLGEGTKTFTHEDDGTKTVSLTGAWCSGISGGWAPYRLAVSGAVTLPSLPRATEPVLAAATIGSAVTVYLPRASSRFTHTLTYRFGSAAGTVAENAGKSCVWQVPESLAAELPNARSGEGSLLCKTYCGSALIGTREVPFTAAVPDTMRPTLSDGWVQLTYDNAGTRAKDITAWVQGYSKAKATFDTHRITCLYGAAVQSCRLTYLGKTAEGNPCCTEPIAATSAPLRCTVTDSRGLSASEDFTVALLPYAPPRLLKADLYRCDENGAPSDSGRHIAGVATAQISPLEGRNTATLKGYWRSIGGSYGSGVTLPSGQAALVTGGSELSAEQSYTALLELTDSLGNTARYEEVIPTEQVTLHLKAGGKGAAFGKAAEKENTLELAEDWELIGGKKITAKVLHAQKMQVDGAVTFGGDVAARGIVGQTLQATAAQALEQTPDRIAVWDGDGRLCCRTPAQLGQDIGVFAQQDTYLPHWSSTVVAGRYVNASTSFGGSVQSPKLDAVQNGVGRSEPLYIRLPYPLTGAVLSGSADRAGYYISSVSRTSPASFTARIYDPYHSGRQVGDALQLVARLAVQGARAQLPVSPEDFFAGAANESALRAADAAAREQAKAVAQSYVSALDGGANPRAFTYGPNILYEGEPQEILRNGSSHHVANLTGARAQCDTLAQWILHGMPYDRSYYVTRSADGTVTPNLTATCDYAAELHGKNPQQLDWVQGLLSYMNYNPYMGGKRDIKYAADIAWLLWYLSEQRVNGRHLACLFTDGAQAQTGDFFFMRDSREQSVFDGVTHVGFLGAEEDGLYRYEVTAESEAHPTAVYKNKLGAFGKAPAYFARLNYADLPAAAE